jgi:hypothetical protein
MMSGKKVLADCPRSLFPPQGVYFFMNWEKIEQTPAVA